MAKCGLTHVARVSTAMTGQSLQWGWALSESQESSYAHSPLLSRHVVSLSWELVAFDWVLLK